MLNYQRVYDITYIDRPTRGIRSKGVLDWETPPRIGRHGECSRPWSALLSPGVVMRDVTFFPEDLREIAYYILKVVIFWWCLSVYTYIYIYTYIHLKQCEHDPLDQGKSQDFIGLFEFVRSQVKITLTTFFKKLCPQASHLHLRMFHNWLKDSC